MADWAARDQRILRIGAVGVALIILLWVVLPMQRNLTEARAHLLQQQQDLDWMRKIGPSLLAAGPAPVAVATQDSLFGSWKARRANPAWAARSHSKPNGSGGMSVTLANVDFNLLLGLARSPLQAAWRAHRDGQHSMPAVARAW